MTIHLKRRFLVRAVVRALAAGALLHGGSASALGLMQAYQAALQNDPTYQSAIHEYEGGQQNRAIGLSNLLPLVQANYSNSKNVADLTQADSFGDVSLTHPKYDSRVASVTIRQSVINFDGLARYRLGIAQTDYSSAVFDSKKQELIVRLMGAYSDALLTNEQLRLAEVQRDMYIEQKKVNDLLFEKGEGTKTDMLETQAKLDLAEAQVIEAQDNRVTALETLAGIVGGPVQSLDELIPEFHIGPPPQGGFETWKKIAIDQNPEVQAQRFAVEAAHQDVNKSKAGYAPRLDIVASYSKNTSQTIDTFNEDSTVRSIGVELTVPLYSGGLTKATTRQSVAAHEKAKSDLDTAIDKVVVEVRKEYSLVVSSASRIRALEKAVDSGKLLMTATEQSIKGGVRINLDLLNAQQQLYTSQRDLAQARYNYLVAIVKLRSVAGMLSVDDVEEMSHYFR
jgi:protease secretion system outer membrane protein